jgi:PAS domain S-box-containing protein
LPKSSTIPLAAPICSTPFRPSSGAPTRAASAAFVNQAWEDYTGRSAEMERGTRWLASVHDEDRNRVARVWDEALGLRRPSDVQYRLLRGDGSYGWVYHAAQPVNDELGRLTGYLGACNDITEQRDAEFRALAKEQEIRPAGRQRAGADLVLRRARPALPLRQPRLRQHVGLGRAQHPRAGPWRR